MILGTITLGWFWSIFAVSILTIIVLAVIFGSMFEDTGIWDGWADKVKCCHKWEKRDDLSNYRTKVIICKECGKVKKVKV
jgi:hypothetical protein